MGCNHDCKNCKEKCDIKDLREKPNKYSSIKKVIGIVSGKGGVGKSLVTSLLAVGLSRDGFNVGILDADITGPSIPRIFGVQKEALGNEYGLLPNVSNTGIKVMSSNLLLPNETEPVVWRGPLIAGLVKQFWTDVIWEGVDYLLVDMPPGTGDVALTVFQSIGVDGIIIVSSPQDLVSMIVTKALKMADMVKIPVLGIVENMSYVECPDCKNKIKVFGESNVSKIAEENNIKEVAKLPINPIIASLCDKGKIEEIDNDYITNHMANILEALETLPLHLTNIACPTFDGELSTLDDCDSINIYQSVRSMVINDKVIMVDDLDKEERLAILEKSKIKVLISSVKEEVNNIECVDSSLDVYEAVLDYLNK